ncbi:Putative Thioredoxin binding protein TBP-2/VDUP1 [Aspergillus calidoustus]|uniref:Putative Thioredoxin binding protein TBP-2/VDUP1 n=1 Tax=Aspergillus calidoustus TaxID=454130 RepID=A0A0U5CRY1_ASPCI|nr:Putative Thioredoxin binding protein TBP-2/VDUP1 [Aspergillus calidoustus]
MTAAYVPQDLPGSVTATNLVPGQLVHDPPEPVPLLSSLLSSRIHRRSGSTATTDTNFATQQFPKQAGLSRRGSIFRKLAGPRENAKRLLRFGTAQSPTPSLQDRPMARQRRHRPLSEIIGSPDDANMLAATSFQPGRMRSHSSSNSSIIARGASPGRIPESAPFPQLPNEKTVATGSGITVGIALTEPVLFLQGYDQNDPTTKKSAILRGQLHLKVTKSVKIKKISICFRGQAQTDWPDGIPPKKIHFHDKKDLVTHGVVYFNHGDTALMQNDYGAHFYQHAKPVTSLVKDGSTTVTREIFTKSGSATSLSPGPTPRELKRLSLQSNNSRSFGRGDTPPPGPPQPQRNYRLFPVGDYLYSFEFPIDGSLPETIKTELGFVKYDLEAIVERAGAFRPNLLGTLEVPVIRTPAEGSLEQVEPIAISRNWEDQLHYDIVISGKSFPLGSQIPIAFKLTPLAKVECHRIKVYVTENIQHWTADKSVHRFQPAKKVLLFEKRADQLSTSTYPGSSMRVMAGGGIEWDRRAAAARGEEIVDRGRTNLLGNLSSESGVGPTEMEFNVQLPSCHEMKNRDESQRLHFDTTYDNIQINHWIKIVLRLSKQDERDPGKRRHFEISIDSPFHLLSCKATQANIFLPAYTSPDSEPATPGPEFECGCAGAPQLRRNPSGTPSSSDRDEAPAAVSRSFTSGSGGLARPPAAHLASEHDGRASERSQAPRPMHLLRAPSFAPPAFDDVPPPPPLITPPPEYTTIVGNNDRDAVLEDYFSRLSCYEERVDEERGSGRVDVPLTPGARVNRSMDVPREWVRIDQTTP